MAHDGDIVWTRNEVESPCVKLCVIEPESGLCMGCYRTRQEVASWSQMTPDLRKSLMAELPSRADQIKPRRRGGRSKRAS